MPIIN